MRTDLKQLTYSTKGSKQGRTQGQLVVTWNRGLSLEQARRFFNQHTPTFRADHSIVDSRAVPASLDGSFRGQVCGTVGR